MEGLTTIIVGVVIPLLTTVTPLYYLVLDLREDLGAAETERAQNSAENDSLADKVGDLQTEIRNARVEMQRIGARSQMNQRHIHDLLISKPDGDSGELSTDPPHTHRECPDVPNCPWHEPADGE